MNNNLISPGGDIIAPGDPTRLVKNEDIINTENNNMLLIIFAIVGLYFLIK